tara:strand:+ start:725 stop:928 length:204 start_codon:yes stop_codon:yes gene_type:complete
LVEDLLEISETGRRKDDGIATTPDILGNSEKSASRVFFESENEGLPLNLNLLCSQSVLIDLRLAGMP